METNYETTDTIYSVDSWTKYIDTHITEHLTTASLANTFHYSETHFRRIFRYYYKMTVSDYIRKRRLQSAAEKLREGMSCKAVSRLYHFKTYAGFTRAFQKEFDMTPTAYSNSTFEVVDLARYYDEYKGCLHITYLDRKETKMIGQSILRGKGADADIPAQVSYWLDKDFPCLENTRFACNKERREEKLALWYQKSETDDIEYLLGPVVDSFNKDTPPEMEQITIAGGKYAMFETEQSSDKENIAESLRMYTRCVYYGWVKEYRERVDLTRITFERYADNKIYLFVPVKY